MTTERRRRLGAQITTTWREREAFIKTLGLTGQALRARLIARGVLKPRQGEGPPPTPGLPKRGAR